ncbi:uncharacterized protein I303_104642 [Kwoniella dejecticola CBS 10117]|uniref:BTB domain-containing protein n=1 Tax=Kwoniella dejecticola CBS 10117 TaxID=1296121 RepID=A0A1A6A4R2_9TREE|nr:uncharacterized protein I303_04378 [Kwoniella dejecticola CBS 10117]OBR85050.1 hypothetical protein I303_04378 [Kwoniella dejecticola CBS 10117]
MEVDNTQKSADAAQVETRPRKSHPIHNNPNASLVIISEDDVELRASSFLLAKVSQFFQDLTSIPLPPEQEREPIHLEYTSEVISLFLIAAVSPPYCHQIIIKEQSADITMTASLLTMAEFTLCHDLILNIRQYLVESAEICPEEVLKLGVDRQDVELIEVALSAYGARKFEVPTLCETGYCSRRCADGFGDTCFKKFRRLHNAYTDLGEGTQIELLELMLLRMKIKAQEYGCLERMIFDKEDWEWISHLLVDPRKGVVNKI